MSDRRLTAVVSARHQARRASLLIGRMFLIAQAGRRRPWTGLLLAAVLMLVCQGVMQHWHAPVHLAQQMLVEIDHDHQQDLGDATDCLSCNLLKLGQVGALALPSLPLLAHVLAPATPTLDWLVDQRLTQPPARGPPHPSSISN